MLDINDRKLKFKEKKPCAIVSVFMKYLRINLIKMSKTYTLKNIKYC